MNTWMVMAQMYWRDHHADWGWWMPVTGMIVFVAFLALVIWAVLRATEYRGPTVIGPHPGSAPDPALETLRMRFARGEIDAAEYAQRAAQLGAPAPPPPPPGQP
jgi:putative membrane protein